MDYRPEICRYLTLEIELIQKLDADMINKAVSLIIDAYNNKKSVFVFGNGGSASTASHFKNDLDNTLFELTNHRLRTICLNDNIPTVLAIANDIGFDEVFRYQLIDKIDEGDIVIAISGSGNSANVINAVRYANAKGNKVIGLTGFDGGCLKKLSDVYLHVPSDNIQIVEDIHLLFNHLLVSILQHYMKTSI